MGDWCSDAYMTYLDLSMDCRVTNMVQFVECMDELMGNTKWLSDADVFADEF